MATGEFGDRLRRARVQAGLTQGQLADMAGIARETVSCIEGGNQTAKQPTVEALFEAIAPNIKNLSATWALWFLTGSSALVGPTVEGSVRRRDFMTMFAAAAALPSTIPSPMLDLERLGAPQLDDHVLDELEAMTAQLARTRPIVTPSRWLRQAEAHLVDLEARITERSATHRLGRRLLSITAGTAALCAWVCLMAERRRDVRAYLDFGEAIAREIDDRDTLSLLLLLRADLISAVQMGGQSVGHPDMAGDFLDEALACTSRASPVSLRAPVLLRRAEEHAFTGSAAKALDCLLQADDAGATGRTKGHPLRPEFTVTGSLSFRGSCLSLLGRCAEAIDVLTPLIEARLPFDRPLLLADLGAAHAQAGDLDHSIEALSTALDLVESGGFSAAARRVAGVRARHLAEWNGEAAVRELDNRLALML